MNSSNSSQIPGYKQAPPGFGRPLPPGTPLTSNARNVMLRHLQFAPNSPIKSALEPGPGAPAATSIQPGGKRRKRKRSTKKRKHIKRRRTRRYR